MRRNGGATAGHGVCAARPVASTTNRSLYCPQWPLATLIHDRSCTGTGGSTLAGSINCGYRSLLLANHSSMGPTECAGGAVSNDNCNQT
jgi:hypothetical protein